MGFPVQFKKFWSRRVIVEERKRDRSYVGLMVGEDPHFVYLEDVVILVNGKQTKTVEMALWKGRIGSIRLAPSDKGDEL